MVVEVEVRDPAARAGAAEIAINPAVPADIPILRSMARRGVVVRGAVSVMIDLSTGILDCRYRYRNHQTFG